MNLRKAENYTVGLDLGTGSVGWAVVDEDGRLLHFKGQPTWGSRLFPSADTAAATRVKRGQRRRYERRRQRIDALQEFFLKEMEQVDPDFFIRLRQSRLLQNDKDEQINGYRWPLFNDSDFTEADYYKRFPTIYHLRKHLMESDSQEDIRLVYLALHNIVKYRGNFLHEDEGDSLKAANANAKAAAAELCTALQEYLRELSDTGDEIAFDVASVEAALDERGVRRGDRLDALIEAISVQDKDARDRCKLACRACVGYKVDYEKMLFGLDKAEGSSFSLSDEEKVQAFADELCPDDAHRLFDALQAAYSSFVLSGLLQGATSISDAMVRLYELHQSDLKILKGLFRDYLTHDQYNEFFRGEEIEPGRYDINKLVKGSYTSYVIGEKGANKKGTSHDELIKKIRELCDSNSSLKEDERYKAISDRLEAGEESDFLVKQKTRSNGAIPYQLHLEEMDAIITAQGKFYPFLLENRESIEKLVSSRIPYYVGPLFPGTDDLDESSNPLRRFAWSVRKPGMEHAKAYPWNVDEVIDTDETARLFIQRMTGTCTYLYGAPVLPRHSLLYEEFCVLNELNGAKWCFKGGKPKRFDHVDKERVFQELFKNRKSASVSYALVQKWLLEEHGAVDAEVSGGQGEAGFESKLTTYHDFCKLFAVRDLDDAPLSFDEMEEIVLWNTVFEDRAILRRKINEKYGPEGDGRLTAEQVKKIVNKRYSGWGRLSKKFLTEIRVPASVPAGSVSIMDVLRNGNPFSHLHQLVLMEILSDKGLGFGEAIEEANRIHFEEAGQSLTIDDMQGSPANRRSVNQAMRILDEIIGIAGKPPMRICIEVTRDDDWKKKGSRTRSRFNQLKEALKAFKADAKLLSDLDQRKDLLDDDRLLLYFEQQGKCMYTGEPLDINQLSSYQIDHIVPQSFIKDDSIDNRVLVKSRKNQEKLDALLLDDSIISARYTWWRALREAGMITARKFERLTTRNLSERQVQGFINRQLVETSQIVKFVRQMCEQNYPSTEVVSVRANVSHGVRDNLELVKCRELNNYHHAHDAFIACQVADFVGRCYPTWQDGVDVRTIMKRAGGLKGRSGFIADSMTGSTWTDQETGELFWDNAQRNAYIKKALGYRTCFISHMTMMQTGAFWDETLFSPRDTTHRPASLSPVGFLPDGSVMRTSSYGGTDNARIAYSSIVVSADSDTTRAVHFIGIPVCIASGCIRNESLIDYLMSALRVPDKNMLTVLGKPIPPFQRVNLDGNEYLLGGKTGAKYEMILAKELVLSPEVTKTIAKLFDATGEQPNAKECIDAYDALSRSAFSLSKKLAINLRLEERRERFTKLSEEEMAATLKGIVLRLDGKNRVVNLTQIGGPANAGKLTESIQNNLDRITWIHQSVTGMFEMHTSFEDLCSGL